MSEAGRDIEALTFGAEGAPVLVLMGRQHPPEITGALALEAFVGRLLESDPLAVRFRDGFRVAVAPVLNPDGVALGQWRHNTRGVDINRDWGPFTQAETRAARDWLASLGELAVAMDFHSTWKDTLYTQPDGADGSRPEFAGALSDRLVHSLGEGAPHRDASHNPDLATSKTWIHETYKIPALTYEVGDSTPGDETIRIARLAAEETMALLLGENE
ncbi:peptidase M14, carboxypeptidase A [Hyphomonas johnsonii MHS-2]|uniref:Peptidase M14, carboxypeptidase A n=1 Tax=Hyphomonas johnsonii MHS-2 TaxID=1280950 RepID=A0A059FBG5_9PROT|nr:peptidase M14, carboxypeptidase A [Hyphomonas johnsonii MHS-2]